LKRFYTFLFYKLKDTNGSLKTTTLSAMVCHSLIIKTLTSAV